MTYTDKIITNDKNMIKVIIIIYVCQIMYMVDVYGRYRYIRVGLFKS